jgi:hypothetical protein
MGEDFRIDQTTAGGAVTLPDQRTVTFSNVPKGASERSFRVNGVEVPPWHKVTFVWAPAVDGDGSELPFAWQSRGVVPMSDQGDANRAGADFEWLKKMIALEEERGEIVPGGAVGGVVARARRRTARSSLLGLLYARLDAEVAATPNVREALSRIFGIDRSRL